ncbi:hypothetical protein ASE08_09185 [Rhizobacter sp. Root16D2]|nr:hypothetical protein ASC88_14315 [Rhizobacter sp. Root29]KQW04277.1 hypothetical protein ASC98_04005 [Rhizobacter sp. Root1238]KRB14601.1 hypothetical protein ASE08_09185 [Rhizobacter sp. Root16D2]
MSMMSWMLIAAALLAALALAGLWLARRRAAQRRELAPLSLPGLPRPVAVERRFRGGGAPATGWPSTLASMQFDEH